MKKWRSGSFVVVLFAVLFICTVSAHTAHAGVTWSADATGILSMTEQIVNNGNGTYSYNYSFTNIADPQPIWWIVLYTDAFPSAATPFNDVAHTGWSSRYGSADASSDISSPEGQQAFVFSYSASDNFPISTPHGIGMGQTVGGFSFTSSTLDTNNKRFVADRQGYWDGNGHEGDPSYWDQSFSYGGFTTASVAPEPISSILFITGGTLLAGRRFIRRKA